MITVLKDTMTYVDDFGLYDFIRNGEFFFPGHKDEKTEQFLFIHLPLLKAGRAALNADHFAKCMMEETDFDKDKAYQKMYNWLDLHVEEYKGTDEKPREDVEVNRGDIVHAIMMSRRIYKLLYPNTKYRGNIHWLEEIEARNGDSDWL